MKVFKSPVGVPYILAAFLTNCLSCSDMSSWDGSDDVSSESSDGDFASGYWSASDDDDDYNGSSGDDSDDNKG
ncbi:Hypothetical protein PHPALM_3090 [Phytophthora palmivora]|uniref:Uncharacterized protein n=1 Tax=Phytophthora palmivora TaxID=4796 RepID=A0A2P4YN88_9STRA|nr:Hypothetical protein PHPALM_3090 [Phytophthora palmivora]